jgi:hypothetical protein
VKNLFCLIGTHDFRRHHIEGDGGTYLECRRCGKVDNSFDPKGNGVIWTFGIGG